MNTKKQNYARLIAIGAIYALIVIVFIGRLLYLQVSGQDYYSMSTPTKTYTRTEVIEAERGEIFDRNGRPLVTNKYTRQISLDYKTRPQTQAEQNDLILDLVLRADNLNDGTTLVAPLPSLELTVTETGIEFTKPEGFESTSRGKRYAKLIDELNVDEDATVFEEARTLMVRYGIMTQEKVDVGEEKLKNEYYYNYTYDTAARLFLYRLDMELSGFSAVQPYTLINNASLHLITSAVEKYPRGLIISTESSRVYNYPGYATHILGRVGKITSSNADYYKELGYSMDARVGIGGVEQAFEEYLHGTDGILTITEDAYGNTLSTEVTREPKAGLDVYLTIDIEMQMVAERALAENIMKIREDAKADDKPLSGEDAEVGALTAVHVETGEILAMCSYPTYNLATFSEDFATLNNDSRSPFLNRATSGRYAPGSTFKVGVAVAALLEGVIDEETIIDAQGEYMYYESANFTPRCWLYLMNGGKHGEIGVIEAIQESCNYFFYEVGRLLTIEKINEYGRHFGLGEATGIELPEQKGILAGPDYRNDNGLDKWSPGDTLQAAIGQSDNLFSPLQITSYISTVLNGGTRYSAHLLDEVRTYSGETVVKSSPKVLDSFEITEEILGIVKEGMKGVMDNGSAASVFAGYEIPVGGKTGTAQVSDKKSDNAIITAFAPFDDPEICVTCIIEQGSNGTDAGYAVRDVFDYYFGVGKYASTADGE